MDRLFVSLLCLVPLLPALAGLVAGASPGPRAGRVALAGATAAGLAAVAATLALLTGATTPRGLPALLLFDRLTATMTLLITCVGWAVVRFSQRYLAGDAREARYYRWLLLTLAAVLALVCAGHLVMLAVAWIATSLCLHQLLLHGRERPGAVFAARKKFVVSRLGDACIIVAAVLLWRHAGTLEFPALFAQAALAPSMFSGAALWLVLGAALKSAQVPFHFWLPATMETPTPVSALMHAGIVNAGGYLMIRLHPLITGATAAMTLLVAFGALTTVFGAIVMLTQPTVKRALAYSTIAQMGFMLLECGLGAFGLAALHLVAHSVYKARAFLFSGSTLEAPPRAAVPLRLNALVAGAAVALVLVGSIEVLTQPVRHGWEVFEVLTGLAVAYGLGRLWSVAWSRRAMVLGGAVAAGFVGLTTALKWIAAWLAPEVPPLPGPAAVAALVFLALFLAQVTLWRAGRHAWSRKLYVHALNGFYVDALTDRLLWRLWPSAIVGAAAPVQACAVLATLAEREA